VPQVRLIDQDGTMIGLTPTHQALKRAQEAGLDLVEVSPNAEPPVCKIIDFGKFKYEAKRKLQMAKKHQKVITVKEIKLRPNIGQHDLDVKTKQIKGFILDKEKVKISMRFKGREMAHNQLGMALVKKIIDQVSDIATIEVQPKIEGNQIIAMLGAK
jgi:translation initiation factor IF-3